MTGADLLNEMAWIGGSSLHTVGSIVADRPLFTAALNKIGADSAALSLLYFQFGRDATAGRELKDGAKWLIDTVGLTRTGWARLAAGKPAQQFADVVGWREVFDMVSALTGDPMDLFVGLSMDPAMLKHCVDTWPYFWEWVGERSGADRQAQILEVMDMYQGCALMRDALKSLGMYDGFLDGLGPGPPESDDTKRMLYYLLLASSSSDSAEWDKLFLARFGIVLNYGASSQDLMTDSTGATIETDNSVAWDKESVVRVWQITDLLPAGDVSMSNRLIREGATGEASGWAGQNSTRYDLLPGDGAEKDQWETHGSRFDEFEIGMSWGTSDMGSTETGAFTDDDDPMRGLNIFDACVRHEYGHNVGTTQGFDDPGGFVYTDFGWEEHTDLEALLRDIVLPERALPLAGIAQRDRSSTRNDVIAAIANASMHSPAAYKAALDALDATLYTKIKDEPFMEYVRERSASSSWDSPNAIGGRSYHVAYPSWGWYSVSTQEYGRKPSRYAMRSPKEWFAECYAIYYAEADMPGLPLGRMLKARNSPAASKFNTAVDPSHSLDVESGQGTVGMPAADPVAGVGDFPMPRPGDPVYA